MPSGPTQQTWRVQSRGRTRAPGVRESVRLHPAMNNLVALSGAKCGLQAHAAGARVLCAAHEALQHTLFAATDDRRLVGVSVDTGELVLEAPLPSPDAALAVHVLAELDAVFVATAAGALLLMHINTEAWETVGEIEGGLLAASCSPDGELVVCLTRSLTLIALSPTSDWEVISERELEPASVDTASQPSFAWRADGLKCTMLARDPAGKSRVTVMDRSCDPEFVGEPFENAGAALAFQPDGSLIAASQRMANRHEIIFFEPNALRHYEFALPPERASDSVQGLAWNADGSLLAVCLAGSLGDAVQLWHRANYHWYLKYEYIAQPLQDAAGQPWTHPCCLWHESDPLSAILSVSSDDARLFTFSWECMVSAPYLFSTNTETSSAVGDPEPPDWSTLASIDGAKLHLTPLRKMIMPPPMCAASFEAPASIISAAWGPGGRLALLCSDRTLLLCSCPFATGEWQQPPVVEAQFELSGRLFQLSWPASGMLMALSFDPVAALIPLPLPAGVDGAGGQQRVKLGPGRAVQVKAGAGGLRLTREVAGGACVLLLGDGSVMTLSTSRNAEGAEHGVQVQVATKLPGPCAVVAALAGGSAQGTHQSVQPGAGLGWVGLSKRGKLWWGSEIMEDGVTSLALHEGKLLLITTAACRLRAYDIVDAGRGPVLLWDDGRMLERGAVLVVAPPADQRVVLSMPRGNLEILHPQLLVVRRACAVRWHDSTYKLQHSHICSAHARRVPHAWMGVLVVRVYGGMPNTGHGARGIENR